MKNRRTKKLIHKKTNKSAIDVKNIISKEEKGRPCRATRGKKQNYKELEKMHIEEDEENEEEIN